MTFIFHQPHYNSNAQPPRCGSARVQFWLLLIGFIAFGSFSRPANAQNFTSPGAWTYTIPAGVTRIQVQVSGAGGGGGGNDGSRGGNGGNGAKVTAVITVTPGQIISGVIGRGGGSAFTSGATALGYTPCSGNGAGGPGFAAGGTGAAANCPGAGYSGSGAGGGGSTNLAIDGIVFVQAGGGGGGAGAGAAVGNPGTTNLSLTSTLSCAITANGTNATVFSGDAGGGGGGGGGFTAGTGGSSTSEFIRAVAGGGGGSCRNSSALISSAVIDATGGTGAIGKMNRGILPGADGGAGSVMINLVPIGVQKTSAVVADEISVTNSKSLPGATLRYCIVVRNNWGGDATNVTLTDVLPAQTSFVTNSFNRGTTCSDATQSEPQASITGSTITADVGALPESASYALVFLVTLN